MSINMYECSIGPSTRVSICGLRLTISKGILLTAIVCTISHYNGVKLVGQSR